jgi:hypothetical protein
MNAADDVIVVHADDADDRRRNRLEVYGRRWAAAQGVPVPRIIDHAPDGSLLISEHVRSRPAEGAEYIEAALEIAARIAGGPPPRPPEATTSWRNPNRRATAQRAVELLVAGISPATFVHARRAASDLPSDLPSHRDFHVHNVLLAEARSAPGGQLATVIDFEYLGLAPRHGDAIRLLTTVGAHADAAHGLDLLLRRTARTGWPALAVQLRWLGLRQLAELVTADDVPAPERARAQQRWHLARTWAREIERTHRGSSPRTSAPRPRTAGLAGAAPGTAAGR